MTLTFQKENVESWDAEKKAIVAECWDEIGHGLVKSMMPVPNMETYKRLEDQGIIHVVTLREDGILIGYCTFFLVNMLHHIGYKKAVCDSIFLRKSKRGPFLGIKLIAETERIAKEAGASEFDFLVTIGLDFGRVLQRLGYAPQNVIHSKVL